MAKKKKKKQTKLTELKRVEMIFEAIRDLNTQDAIGLLESCKLTFVMEQYRQFNKTHTIVAGRQ